MLNKDKLDQRSQVILHKHIENWINNNGDVNIIPSDHGKNHGHGMEVLRPLASAGWIYYNDDAGACFWTEPAMDWLEEECERRKEDGAPMPPHLIRTYNRAFAWASRFTPKDHQYWAGAMTRHVEEEKAHLEELVELGKLQTTKRLGETVYRVHITPPEKINPLDGLYPIRAAHQGRSGWAYATRDRASYLVTKVPVGFVGPLVAVIKKEHDIFLLNVRETNPSICENDGVYLDLWLGSDDMQDNETPEKMANHISAIFIGMQYDPEVIDSAYTYGMTKHKYAEIKRETINWRVL